MGAKLVFFPTPRRRRGQEAAARYLWANKEAQEKRKRRQDRWLFGLSVLLGIVFPIAIAVIYG